MLSDRVRPGVEVAPWVVDEIKKLEKELHEAYIELGKQMPSAVFDRDVWVKAREYCYVFYKTR